MNFRCIKIGLCGLLISFSWTVSAVPISYNGYTLNGDIVSDGALEWLQWDVTAGLSISDALADPIYAGWTLASNQQMAGLFTLFGFNTAAEGLSITTNGDYVFGSDNSEFDHFMELFGTTDVASTGAYGTGYDMLERTAAFYGSDADGDSMFNLSIIESDSTISSVPYDAYAHLNADYYSPTSRVDFVGVALVRQVADVPAPPTAAILAFGLIGLGLRRFKKQS